eukprot:SAG11_NODE_29549_length_309_cov_1.947619_1_plen_84_part_10
MKDCAGRDWRRRASPRLHLSWPPPASTRILNARRVPQQFRPSQCDISYAKSISPVATSVVKGRPPKPRRGGDSLGGEGGRTVGK